MSEKFGSAFVLAACDDYTDAQLCGDDDRARDIFLRVANRCAQLEIWLDHQHGDAAPPEDDPCWEEHAKWHDDVEVALAKK